MLILACSQVGPRIDLTRLLKRLHTNIRSPLLLHLDCCQSGQIISMTKFMGQIPAGQLTLPGYQLSRSLLASARPEGVCFRSERSFTRLITRILHLTLRNWWPLNVAAMHHSAAVRLLLTIHLLLGWPITSSLSSSTPATSMSQSSSKAAHR